MHEQQQARLSRASSMRPIEDQQPAGRGTSSLLGGGPAACWAGDQQLTGRGTSSLLGGAPPVSPSLAEDQQLAPAPP